MSAIPLPLLAAINQSNGKPLNRHRGQENLQSDYGY
jgi:hypothetical protein